MRTKTHSNHTRIPYIAVVAALGLVFSVTACSMKQDPFAEKSEAIKQGVPPEVDRPPVAPKPLASDALRIDAPIFHTFKELIESELSIKGRVLDGLGSTFELSIDNLRDFPGATFDKTTGIFKWEPPRDTTGGEYGLPKRLVVRLSVDPVAGGTKLGTTQEILIYVTRSEVDPEVVSVDDGLIKPEPVREGELRKFTVTVKDPDSVDADGLRPRLVSVPAVRGTSDISSLVYMDASNTTDPNPKQDPSDKSKWIFKMVLDLRAPADQRGRDFTRTRDDFKFGLQVVSRFGRVGMKDVTTPIVTSVLKPEVTWFDPIEAIAGQENVIQFHAYDPYSEGKVSVNFITRIDQLPGAGVAFCKLASRDGAVLCRISWKPSATTKGDFPVEFEVLNETRAPGDRLAVKEVFRRVIRVIPGAVPASANTPANAAVPTNPAKPVTP